MENTLINRMRLEILGNIEDTSQDELFNIKLEDAKWIALDTLYPFDNEVTKLPEKYKNWQVRCAIELYNAIGQEGYIKYAENGLSWEKASDLVSSKLMNELTPKADIPR